MDLSAWIPLFRSDFSFQPSVRKSRAPELARALSFCLFPARARCRPLALFRVFFSGLRETILSRPSTYRSTQTSGESDYIGFFIIANKRSPFIFKVGRSSRVRRDALFGALKFCVAPAKKDTDKFPCDSSPGFVNVCDSPPERSR